MRPPRLFCLLLMPALGCGLSAYEAKMLDAQRRLARFEEESQHLGDPLVVPHQGGKALPLDVFLRPPKGVQKEAKKEQRGDLFYVYPGPAGGPVTGVELALGAGEKDFAKRVLEQFDGDKPAWKPVQVRGPGRGPVAFAAAEWDGDRFGYAAYVWEEDKKQVAIVFWTEKGKREAARKGVGMSLESFAAGGDAHRARARPRGTPLQAAPGGPR